MIMTNMLVIYIIYYNYSVQVMRNKQKSFLKKKATLKEYCKIKVYIKCVFLFFLNSKTKYTSQTPTVNHSLYKTHKSIMSNLNIKIIIVVVTQYKMRAFFFGCSQLILHVRIR